MKIRLPAFALCVVLSYLRVLHAAPPVQAVIALVPQPVKIQINDGRFQLTADTLIQAPVGHNHLGEQMAEMFAPATGFAIKTQTDIAPAGQNVIEIDLANPGSQLADEGYRLHVEPHRIVITAKTEAGAFYGFQTLRQLFPPAIFAATPVDHITWDIPCITIEDQPRFRYRGMMLDCSRHFMTKAFVLRFIDLLAIHKLNVFQWHLTDDQGWRLEIKKYPRLTQIGGWRKETLIGHYTAKDQKFDGHRYGGFYTQDDVKEVIAYAAQRHITVIPEIEMPGHSCAAIAAYPELGCVSEPVEVKTTWGVEHHILNADESTILFYQDVLAEVMALFPSPYIHIGGDEAVKDEWNASPKIQARMTQLGLKNAHDLQAYFIGRMDQYLTAHGRHLLGWDEILDGGLSPNATVMSWHGPKGAIQAAQQGHDAVMAPKQFTYFDYCQSKDAQHEPLAIGGYLPLEKVYAFDPLPAELTPDQATHLLGGQAQLWSEYLPDPQQVEYMAYPRGCALAEDLWTPAESKNEKDFMLRLQTHLLRLKSMNVHYREPDREPTK